MDFEDVLNDIAKLCGKQLKAINPQTGFIEISDINKETQNFRVRINGRKESSRPISQLEKIWTALSHSRVADTEAISGGSGSSRHVPETIFANLPYVEHFKYNRKKQLYLNEDHTHEFGTLKSVEPSEYRKIKSKLDKLNRFDPYSFSSNFEHAINLLTSSTAELKVKFPGEFKASVISDVEQQLRSLLGELKNTVFEPLDQKVEIISAKTDTIDLDSPEFVGFDGGQIDIIEGVDEAQSESVENSEMLSSRIRFTPTTVSLIYDRLQHGEIELQPEFQRKDRIWPQGIKSKLIESVLIGLPIPTLYFGERSNGDWVIIDGLQRTTTFYDFITGEFALTGLELLGEYNGHFFNDLPRPLQRKMREYQLHCHVITIQKDSDRMVRELFQRINTYGVKMSYQEIRCALYPGSSVTFIRYIAERKAFLDATFGKVQPKRMRDMELILGVIAFTVLGFEQFSASKFDTFLTETMQKLNNLTLNIENFTRVTSLETKEVDVNSIEFLEGSDPLYLDLCERIEIALRLATVVFDVDRFKKEIGGRVINKSIFELIVSTFALLPREHHDLLISNKEAVKSNFYDLLSGKKMAYVDWGSDTYKDRDFEYSVSQSTGKRVTINYRFRNFHALLEDVLEKELSLKGLLSNDD